MQSWFRCFISPLKTQFTEILYIFFFASTSWTPAGDPDGDFQLHTITGALSTSRGLNRETRAEYILKVVATDRGSPALSTTVTVEVKVLDVNDNSPVFSKTSYSVDLSEDAVEGSKVLEVSRNGNLIRQPEYRLCSIHFVYKIFHANHKNVFSVLLGVRHRCWWWPEWKGSVFPQPRCTWGIHCGWKFWCDHHISSSGSGKMAFLHLPGVCGWPFTSCTQELYCSGKSRVRLWIMPITLVISFTLNQMWPLPFRWQSLSWMSTTTLPSSSRIPWSLKCLAGVPSEF